jgi:predicted metallopeptidase
MQQVAHDLLHLLIRKTAGVRPHSQRIAAEARFREYVTSYIQVFHQTLAPHVI